MLCVLVAQLCPTLCDPVDCSLPDSSVHRLVQARILEWVAISFSKGSSQPRDHNWVSCTEYYGYSHCVYGDEAGKRLAFPWGHFPEVTQLVGEQGIKERLPPESTPLTIKSYRKRWKGDDLVDTHPVAYIRLFVSGQWSLTIWGRGKQVPLWRLFKHLVPVIPSSCIGAIHFPHWMVEPLLFSYLYSLETGTAHPLPGPQPMEAGPSIYCAAQRCIESRRETQRERQTGARARVTDYIFAVTTLPRARKKTQHLF